MFVAAAVILQTKLFVASLCAPSVSNVFQLALAVYRVAICTANCILVASTVVQFARRWFLASWLAVWIAYETSFAEATNESSHGLAHRRWVTIHVVSLARGISDAFVVWVDRPVVERVEARFA